MYVREISACLLSGMFIPAKRAIQVAPVYLIFTSLTLALLVSRFAADHSDNPFTPNNFAISAHLFY
jgi:hypothetical protein